MIFFVCNYHNTYKFSLKFEKYDLSHTYIEVSFDGFAYRFPNAYIREWLSDNLIAWHWSCKKTEIWKGEPHSPSIQVHHKPPSIRFSSRDDALLFKLTWDEK